MSNCLYCTTPLPVALHGNRKFCSVECRNRLNNARAKRREVADDEHGRRIGYARGCKCDLCMAYNANYSKQMRAKQPKGPRKTRSDKGLTRVEIPHGTRSGYSHHGCRCDLCRQGAAIDNATTFSKDPERHRQYRKAYLRANPHKVATYSLPRRSAPFDAVALAYCDLLQGDPCAYCGEPADTIDHIEAVTRSRTSDWNNLAPACRRCNSRKGAKRLLRYLMRMKVAS